MFMVIIKVIARFTTRVRVSVKLRVLVKWSSSWSRLGLWSRSVSTPRLRLGIGSNCHGHVHGKGFH